MDATNSSFYWPIPRRHLLLLRFILRSIYISWVLFTDCTKGPRGPSLCWSSVPWIESSIRILDRNVHLLTLACKASSSCVWLTRANIPLQRCIVKAKKKCFFSPPGWTSIWPNPNFSHSIDFYTRCDTKWGWNSFSPRSRNMFTAVQSAVIQWILFLSILKWLYIYLTYFECLCW